VLINKVNLEGDVFLNLTHVQIHRRAKALQRIAALVDADSFGLLSLQSFILPITLHALFDESSSGLEIVESKGKSVSINKSGYSAVGGSGGASSGLHAEAVKLITSISKKLPWESYAQTMRKIMRLVSSVSDPTLEKVLVRAVAGIAEGFHFDLAEATVSLNVIDGANGGIGSGQALMEIGERQFLAQLITSISSGSASGKATQTTSSASALRSKVAPAQAIGNTEEGNEEEEDDEEEGGGGIEKIDADPVSLERERRVRLQILCGSLLPQLRGLLHRPVPDDEKSENRGSKLLRKSYEVGELRPSVALALIAVLSRLPKQVFEAELPGLIADVCNALRSRSQERRDSARATLARMAGALGPSRLLIILKELRDALREGYQVHIMGHALFDVISSLSTMMQPALPPIPKAFMSSSSSSTFEAVTTDDQEKVKNTELMLAASVAASDLSGGGVLISPICFSHYMTAGTTSSTTFRVRAGAAGAATTTFNGTAGARKFGGVASSSITITEYKA
jgi:U3 small nucleolar RNA-associated protein 20